ncbi:MAG TPA: hypothetical protein VED40_05590 [Azospirillaceae bacterium]|nr:hypothetical protein [Azospirillaceae bacterium]
MIVRARAPLRLGFAGGGTDLSPYCDQFGGYILNGTIGMYAYTHLEPRKDKGLRFVAADREAVYEGGPEETIRPGDPLALHKAVYRRIVRDFCKGEPLGVTVTTYADVPPGSGLGSSSTVVVSMIEAYKEWLGLPLGEYDVAHLAWEIERIDLGLSGGKQDQYAATFGGFNFMEFYDRDRVIVNPLRIKQSILRELEASLVIYYTGVSRESANIIDQQVAAVKEQKSESLEAMHRLKQDAVAMKEALLRGNIRQVARILGSSWESKKRTAAKISSSAIDEVYERALAAGAYGGKVSGAGGGGFVMFLVDPTRRPELMRALKDGEGTPMLCQFSEGGAAAWRG